MPLNELAQRLQRIQIALQSLVDDHSLSQQENTFVTHMQRTAAQLYEMVAEIPPGLQALHDILPTIPERFEQSQAGLYGYAKMLREQPAVFGGVQSSAVQQAMLTSIYEESIALSQRTVRLRREAAAVRLKQRQQPASPFDVYILLHNALPVYAYYLRHASVHFSHHLELVPDVYGHPYHLNALIRHVLVCIVEDLLEYGEIRLSLVAIDEQRVSIDIFATGLTGSAEEYRTLFQKEGRQVYLRQLEKHGGALHVQMRRGIGTALQIHLPIANSLLAEAPIGV